MSKADMSTVAVEEGAETEALGLFADRLGMLTAAPSPPPPTVAVGKADNDVSEVSYLMRKLMFFS
jgi:hypothetical protein